MPQTDKKSSVKDGKVWEYDISYYLKVNFEYSSLF